MLKKCLLMLPLLSTIPAASMADDNSAFSGDWKGTISTSMAGSVPGTLVGYSLIADHLNISETGAITGTVFSSTGKSVEVTGNVDAKGSFTLKVIENYECEASGTAQLMHNRDILEFAGNGTCTFKGTTKTVYSAVSITLAKSETFGVQ